MAYREPGEEPDDRPLVVYTDIRRDYYRDGMGRIQEKAPEERYEENTRDMEYQNTVEANPRAEGEGPMAYVKRIAEFAEGRLSGVQSMPRRNQSRRERDARLQELRVQAARMVTGERD